MPLFIYLQLTVALFSFVILGYWLMVGCSSMLAIMKCHKLWYTEETTWSKLAVALYNLRYEVLSQNLMIFAKVTDF